MDLILLKLNLLCRDRPGAIILQRGAQELVECADVSEAYPCTGCGGGRVWVRWHFPAENFGHLGRVLRYAFLLISISFEHDDCTALPEGGVRQSTTVRASEDDCNERRQAKTVYIESTVPLKICEWRSSDLSPEMHATKETEWHPLRTQKRRYL